MRTLTFANRNLKEILRDPLSLIFCFMFPLALLGLMVLIVNNIGADLSNTPQFKIENLFVSICVFSYTFLILFSSMLISKDRNSAFQTRLTISPLKPYQFFLGYAIPLIPIGILQTIMITLFCIILGLSLSLNILVVCLFMLPAMLLYISIGIILGTLFNDKACGGLSSLIINISVFLSGMFFPLEIMNGILPTICYALPFAPSIAVPKAFLTQNFTSFTSSLLTIILYDFVLLIIATLIFNKKLKNK